MAAQGDTVFTEYTEEWRFHTGEIVTLPAVSAHVFEGGGIELWRD